MFKDRLISLRKQKGLTQKELADLLHCSANAVGKYERGESEPDLQTITFLSNYFNVSSDYLLDIESKRNVLTPDDKKIINDALKILSNFLNEN